MVNHRQARTVIIGVIVAVVLTLAASVAVTAALGDTASPEATADDGKVVLRIGWSQEPDTLNPYVGVNGTDYQIWHMNYDFLVGFSAEDLSEPRPELAETWSVSEDGKTWTFNIRKGVKWHDGEPLTAKDVAFTFNNIREKEALNQAIYTEGITSAEAVSDYVVEIRTAQPKSNILRMVVPILPEHIWGKLDKKESMEFQNDPPLIGTGPFQCVEWKHGSFIRMVANKDYWGGAPKVDEVIFETYQNPVSIAQDLKVGALDGGIYIPLAQFEGLESVAGITTNAGTSWRFAELGFNCYDDPDSMGNPALLDQTFRQALSRAVDKEKICQLAFQGHAEPGSTVIVPASPFHYEPTPEEIFDFDLDKANSMLEAAGYKDVDGDGYRETKDGERLSLRLTATTDYTPSTMTGKLMVGWFKQIGIKTVLSSVDPGVLIDMQYNYKGDTYAPDYDMYLWYWTQDVDPQAQVGIYTPQQIEGWNDCLWTDPEYTKLNEEQMQAVDESERIPIVQEMQRMFYESAAYIVYAYPSLPEAYNTQDWDGWVHAPSDVGTVLYNYNNVDTYRFVHLKTVEAGADGSGSGPIVMVVAAAVVAIAVAAWLLLRRRGGPALED